MGVHEDSAVRAERFGDRDAVSSGEYHGWSLRSVMRSLLLTMVATAGAMGEGAAETISRPRVQILLLHHVFEHEAPRLRKLLKRLAQTHEFIGYGEAVERIATGRITRPAIAFSFDDGLDNCRTAAAILRDHGARACFFVVPSMVGERNRALVRRFCVERLHSPPVPLLGWAEIDGLLAQGHEIGSHTWSHLDLGAADEGQVVEQVVRARDELVRRVGEARHFAWPYGTFDRFSAFAARTAFTSGHRSVASAVRGCHLPGAPATLPVCLRRDNVQADWPWAHIRWFLARASRESATDAGEHPGGWPASWAGALGGLRMAEDGAGRSPTHGVGVPPAAEAHATMATTRRRGAIT